MRNFRFTFPELLVITAVLAFQAALLAPTLGSLREEARRRQCASNLRETGNAIGQFERDHDAFPESDATGKSFGMLLEEGYLSDPAPLSCPSNPVDADPDAGPEGVSYYLDTRTPRQRHTMRALAADRNSYGDWTDNHGADGVNVLFGAGALVQFVGPDDSGRIANPHLPAGDVNIYYGPAGDEKNANISYFSWSEDGVITFTHSTQFTWTEETADVTVVVVGGGAGHRSPHGRYGGGGGAGGVEIVQGVTLAQGASLVQIEIGEGGRGYDNGSPATDENKGGTSRFSVDGTDVVAAEGGGAGGRGRQTSAAGATGQAGGSGGGGGCNTQTDPDTHGSGGAGHATYGHAGAASTDGAKGGGGGGAGEAGSGRNGGDGINLADSDFWTTNSFPDHSGSFEDEYWLAGGGAAAGGAAGKGGGAQGWHNAGVDGTGGGGAGGSNTSLGDPPDDDKSSGGSGVVILLIEE